MTSTQQAPSGLVYAGLTGSDPQPNPSPRSAQKSGPNVVPKVVRRDRLALGSPRELGTVALVSGLAGGFAAVLVLTSQILVTIADDEPIFRVLLDGVSGVFIAISLYVAAIVTVNCVATVLAGRQHQLALLRLLGASAADLRRSVTATATRAGLVGGLIGVALGTAGTNLARIGFVARGDLPELNYPWVAPQLLIALFVVTATAAVAGWFGSRAVLTVSPAAALAGSTMARAGGKGVGWLRRSVTAVLLLGGAALMGWSMQLGETGESWAVMVAFAGCAGLGTGLLVGGQIVVPRLVSALGRLFGSTPPLRIARRNAVLDPARAARSTMGLVFGVALVTTFAAGADALQRSVAGWGLSPEGEVMAQQGLKVTSAVMISLVLISTVIAAVGFASTMSLTVIQRRREMGLLRALGFTRGQLRTMVSAEAMALAIFALAFGTGLGVLFGMVGAQSMFGHLNDGLVWGVPTTVLAATAIGGLVLVIVASQVPASRALRVPPVRALHND